MAEVQLIDILYRQICCYVLLCTFFCFVFQNIAILPSIDLRSVRGWRTGWYWWWAAKSLSGCNLSCSVTWEPRHHHEYTPLRPPHSPPLQIQGQVISTYNPNYYLLTGSRNRMQEKPLTVKCSALDHANSNTYCSIVPVELSKLLFVRSPNRRKKSC